MKLCAVICEFNPFHNGHKYFLNEAKRLSGCDGVLCVMSGNFVQRAVPAAVDKYVRAEAALMNGADIVAELPALYATANAEYFAYGGVNIASQFKDVTRLAFGCENPDIALLTALAKIQNDETSEFKRLLSEQLNGGLPYAKSYAKATSLIAEKHNIPGSMSDIVLFRPNNLLAIEYIKQLLRCKSSVVPLCVKRVGGGYNDVTVGEGPASAAAIRQKIAEGGADGLEEYIPENCLPTLLAQLKLHPQNDAVFDAFVIDALTSKTLANLFDAGEGLENKLKKNAETLNTLTEIIDGTKSKRYTAGRIRRLCLQALLDINKNTPDTSVPLPVKLLGIKSDFRPHIARMPQTLIAQNSDYDKFDERYADVFRVEKRAANLYAVITGRPRNAFYSCRPVII
ncbi:MAG: nucleotidyltransferase family protein [Clostridiales bacterium]|jgi:predicted nucleotidyltransferase|nr:nucleotidyltransferase family protein [Clostridiales bacterium]